MTDMDDFKTLDDMDKFALFTTLLLCGLFSLMFYLDGNKGNNGALPVVERTDNDDESNADKYIHWRNATAPCRRLFPGQP